MVQVIQYVIFHSTLLSTKIYYPAQWKSLLFFNQETSPYFISLSIRFLFTTTFKIFMSTPTDYAFHEENFLSIFFIKGVYID